MGETREQIVHRIKVLAVNACSLSVDPTAGVGTLFSLLIPAELIVKD